MTTMEELPTGGTSHTIKLLASAYAERLSCLRCDAGQAELDENRQLIERLERRYRAERGRFGLHLVRTD